LELAEYFASQGARVIVATHAYGAPVSTNFESLADVEVIETSDPRLAQVLRESPPDLAWIQHSILPRELLLSAPAVVFVFNHMSHILPAEFTMAADLENSLASAVVFESPRSLEIHRATGVYDRVDPARLQVFGNPAPAAFSAQSGRESATPRLLAVSNHIPPELAEALDELTADFDLTIIGSQLELGAKPQRVTADVLAEFDAVISIGKTVQYALVGGIPVYCYDHFGGPGWIDRANIEHSRWQNFSGRESVTKPSEDIVREVRDGYPAARVEAALLREDWHRVFSLPERMEDLLGFIAAEPRSIESPTAQQIQAQVNVQDAFASYVREWVRRDADATLLQARLEASQGDVANLTAAIEEIKSSRSYRTGNKIVSILSPLKRRR
jgi:hypothetical protein